MKNKRLYDFRALFYALLLVANLAACAQTGNKLLPHEFKQETAARVQLLDVRTIQEFERGHLPNAMLADWNNQADFKRNISYLNKEEPIYVYCASGPRSDAAAAYLRKNGFSQVYELKGGLNNWKRKGLDLDERGSEKQITIQAFQAQINGPGIVLVNVGAPWCPPCRKMQPILKQLEQQNGNKFKMVHIDAGVDTDISNYLKAEVLPLYLLFKDGKEIWRKEGLVSYDEFKQRLGL